MPLSTIETLLVDVSPLEGYPYAPEALGLPGLEILSVPVSPDPSTPFPAVPIGGGVVTHSYLLSGYVTGVLVIWVDSDRAGSHGPPGVTGISLVNQIS